MTSATGVSGTTIFDSGMKSLMDTNFYTAAHDNNDTKKQGGKMGNNAKNTQQDTKTFWLRVEPFSVGE